MRFLKTALLLAAVTAHAQTDAPLKLNFQPAPEITVPTNDVRRDATVAAIERALPSVVNVATESPISVRDAFEEQFQQFLDQRYGRVRPKTAMSIGSGVIIDEDGYLLTNDHVVRRANKIQIQLANTREVFNATVIVRDPAQDLALLKIAAPTGTKFTAIQFAHDDDVLLGETVIALGNPFGLGGSVSRGIVSSKSREVIVYNDGETLKLTCLQTDAAVNPGNSGGPLVNLHGELVGINSAIRAGAQGISFAVPARQINEALAAALTPEAVRQLWFGARVKAGGGPLTITEIEVGSPAAIAGLKVGDTVLEVNGQKPRSFVAYTELLTNAAQSNVVLAVTRGLETKTLKVQLVPEKDFFNNDLLLRRLGLSVQPITQKLATSLGLPVSRGFIVTGLDAAAETAGLQRGAIIADVDGQAPDSLTALGKIVHRKNSGEKIPLGVLIQQNVQQGSFIRTSLAQATVELRAH